MAWPDLRRRGSPGSVAAARGAGPSVSEDRTRHCPALVSAAPERTARRQAEGAPEPCRGGSARLGGRCAPAAQEGLGAGLPGRGGCQRKSPPPSAGEQVGRARGQGRSPRSEKFQERCHAMCLLRKSLRVCGTRVHRQPPGPAWDQAKLRALPAFLRVLCGPPVAPGDPGLLKRSWPGPIQPWSWE